MDVWKGDFLLGHILVPIYREREREREREGEKEERERQERAKSAQLMQGRAKLATLGREVSILKKSHARTRFEKETGKGDICFSREEVPTSPGFPIISDIPLRPYTRAVGSSRPANSGKARHLFIDCPVLPCPAGGDGVHEPHHHHQLDRGN